MAKTKVKFFETKNILLDEEINYINYSKYFGNQNINYKLLENSGNLIISQTIDYYWDNSGHYYITFTNPDGSTKTETYHK